MSAWYAHSLVGTRYTDRHMDEASFLPGLSEHIYTASGGKLGGAWKLG